MSLKIDDLKTVIGQSLNAIKEKDNSWWLIFDDDVIIIRMPEIDCRCIDCADKHEEG